MRKLNWEILCTSAPTPSSSGWLGWLWTVAASGTAAVAAAAAGPGHPQWCTPGRTTPHPHVPTSCDYDDHDDDHSDGLNDDHDDHDHQAIRVVHTTRQKHSTLSCAHIMWATLSHIYSCPRKKHPVKGRKECYFLFVTQWITIFVYGLILLTWILFESSMHLIK